MKLLTVFGLLLFLFSCEQNKSDIEIIKFDAKTIDDLYETSDTIYSENIGRTDFYTADYYVNLLDSVITKIFKDSIGNVVAINKSKNDKVIFVIEYFTNGQVMGELPGKIEGEYNGPARYYYEDGRVKSEGMFNGGLWSGEWKNYDKNGILISIEEYGDGNIDPIKTTKVK